MNKPIAFLDDLATLSVEHGLKADLQQKRFELFCAVTTTLLIKDSNLEYDPNALKRRADKVVSGLLGKDFD